MFAGSFLPTELGLGLEDSGLGLALGLGCCRTYYKSVLQVAHRPRVQIQYGLQKE